MAKLGPHRFSADVTTPKDGAGAPDAKLAERYCALCGQQADPGAPAIDRFGEAFCSEAHAQEFVQAVRTARVQAAAAAVPATTQVERADAAEPEAARRSSWKGLVKMGLCCGLPILALVVLAGGGGALLGAASGLLPVLALLACPLGMYFMMRAMSKAGDQGNSKDKGGDR
jgi:hypothetical protein